MQKDLDQMFADIGEEDLGQDDVDAIDKMAVDKESDIYDDGWVIDDDDEPGGAAAYKNPNAPVDHDGQGMREMGSCML